MTKPAQHPSRANRHDPDEPMEDPRELVETLERLDATYITPVEPSVYHSSAESRRALAHELEISRKREDGVFWKATRAMVRALSFT